MIIDKEAFKIILNEVDEYTQSLKIIPIELDLILQTILTQNRGYTVHKTSKAIIEENNKEREQNGR